MPIDMIWSFGTTRKGHFQAYLIEILCASSYLQHAKHEKAGRGESHGCAENALDAPARKYPIQEAN